MKKQKPVIVHDEKDAAFDKMFDMLSKMDSAAIEGILSPEKRLFPNGLPAIVVKPK